MYRMSECLHNKSGSGAKTIIDNLVRTDKIRLMTGALLSEVPV